MSSKKQKPIKTPSPINEKDIIDLNDELLLYLRENNLKPQVRNFLNDILRNNIYYASYKNGSIVDITHLEIASIDDKIYYIKDLIDLVYLKPVKDMPLYLNDPLFKVIARWRLKKNK